MTVDMKVGITLKTYQLNQLEYLQRNDTLAVGVLNGIRDDGLSVPDDYELICFEHSILRESSDRNFPL